MPEFAFSSFLSSLSLNQEHGGFKAFIEEANAQLPPLPPDTEL